jgi:hypothetical protein
MKVSQVCGEHKLCHKYRMYCKPDKEENSIYENSLAYCNEQLFTQLEVFLFFQNFFIFFILLAILQKNSQPFHSNESFVFLFSHMEKGKKCLLDNTLILAVTQIQQKMMKGK